jgi:hypothetical protein
MGCWEGGNTNSRWRGHTKPAMVATVVAVLLVVLVVLVVW